jgi:hypothetical protein
MVMQDMFYLGVMAALLVASLLYVKACERL